MWVAESRQTQGCSCFALFVEDCPRFTANVEASTVVETIDAENGRLEPATEAALVAIHPYHRAAIEMHTAMLGVSPLRLPVDWSVVAANLEASGT